MNVRDHLGALLEKLKRLAATAFDLMALNILFILCCVPVITAGAAAVACYSCILRMLRGKEQGMPFGAFFKDFARAFKTATPVWLLLLLCLLILAGDYFYAVYVATPVNKFFLIFAIVMAAVLLGAAAWVFPLMARFENTARAHMKNAFLMAFANLPRTLLVLVLQAVCLLMPVLLQTIFYVLGWLWLLLCFSGAMYLTAYVLRKPLQALPPEKAEEKKEVFPEYP